MPIIPGLSETLIRQYASAESFSRGQQYYQMDAVSNLVLRDSQIQAQVEGSSYEPYRVRIGFDEGGLQTMHCTCPYDWDGACKHIIAVLLACLHDPESVQVHLPLADTLAELDRNQLQELVLRLAAHDDSIADAVDSHIELLRATHSSPQEEQSPAASTTARRTPVDTQPFRRQIRSILRSSHYNEYSYDYGYASDIVEQVREILQQARGFLAGGDGRNALLILEAITDEYSRSWYEFDDSDGEFGAFFMDLAECWAEALLIANLTLDERREWAQKLANWRHEAEDYGAGDELAIAENAAQQGWDDPELVEALQGKLTEKSAWTDEISDYAGVLTQVRLNLLEQQERYQEYLNLAKVEEQIERYVTMLAKTGQEQQAIDEGIARLATAQDALRLAQVLRNRNNMDGAVRIAEHGLTLAEPRGPLAAWLSDLACSLGRSDLALHAAELEFRSTPSLNAYEKVHELAGESWPTLKAALLKHLRQNSSSWLYSSASIDIFLHEELIDDAITVVSQSGGYSQIERVMDAAISHRPDWVIQQATLQAERIMDAGKAQSYHHATNWLRRARDAYRIAGRQAEWQRYLNEIREKHGRKYKLMGLLSGL
jgi:uncharacterized Zn finger protein